MYPLTAIGKFFASVISLVGIGIIAIPTGIIAAGFNQVISREKDELNSNEHPSYIVEDLSQEELLALQARIVKKLSDDGYFLEDK